MADTKLADIASGAPAAATDIIYAVKDPGGTPADAKLTLGEVIDLVESSANTFTANQTFSAQATLPLQTLTDGANIAWNCNNGAKAKVTLGGNRTFDAVTNAVEGTSYTLWVIQDGTGGRTITWANSGAGSFDFGADGAPALTTTLNQADVLGFEAISIGGTLKLRFVGIKKGFA